MALTFLGKLVDPTDQYTSHSHRVFSQCLVRVITVVVGNVTTLAFGAQALVLLSIFFSVIDFNFITNSWTLSFLWIWSLIEVLFYYYCLTLKQKLDAPMTLPSLSWEEKEYFLERVLEQCEDPSAALVRWFHLNPVEDYGIECLATWISWAYFGKLENDLNETERQELTKLVQKIVAKHPKLGKSIGNADTTNFMRLHLDEVAVQHKPFVGYVVISAMQMFGSLFLTRLGFKHHQLSGGSRLSYWTYDPVAPNDDQKSIFLVHGIGIGIAMYFKLVQGVVSANPGNRIFILELPHISLRVMSRIPSIEETLKAVDEIFERHSVRNCSWLAHSYGTIVTTWIVKERPDFVKRITYVDPVCFALWEPDLIFNFLYKVPPSPIHRLCQFFVAQDLVVASTLFRNFSWLRNILFPDDIHCPAQVFISSHDFIIDPNSIYRYLELHNTRVAKKGDGRIIGVKIMDGLSHGSILNSSSHISDVISHI